VERALSGIATLKATPIGMHTSRSRSARSKRRSKSNVITVVARQRLVAGRALTALKRLVPGVSYRLRFTIRSADGQTVRDTATLKVAEG
jgi:hypothetical protein